MDIIGYVVIWRFKWSVERWVLTEIFKERDKALAWARNMAERSTDIEYAVKTLVEDV